MIKIDLRENGSPSSQVTNKSYINFMRTKSQGKSLKIIISQGEVHIELFENENIYCDSNY